MNVKALVPKNIKRMYQVQRALLGVLRFATYDLSRYIRSCSAFRLKMTIQQEDALITMQYHTVEKGLALKEPRPGFGIIVIERLANAVYSRIVDSGPWTEACANGLAALIAYQAFNDAAGVARNAAVERSIKKAEAAGLVQEDAKPTKRVRRDEILTQIDFNAGAFFWSRHSVRQFEAGPIDKARFIEALDLARSSPSVCNRQTARVRYVINNGSNLGFLELQNGNRGFGSSAQAILVVSSELSCFVDATERYQGWIDGGMFAMSLILGLHSKGFGTCCLNWSQTHTADLELRRRLGLPSTESVIMLIAVGNMPDEFPVAMSNRLSHGELIMQIEPLI